MDILCFFCLVFAMPFCASVYRCFVVTCWEKADIWLSFVVSTASLSLSHWYPESDMVLVVSIPDLCTLTYFHIIVPHDAFFQICTKSSAPPNMWGARAPDKKCFK